MHCLIRIEIKHHILGLVLFCRHHVLVKAKCKSRSVFRFRKFVSAVPQIRNPELRILILEANNLRIRVPTYLKLFGASEKYFK
jgi:hypothetical protein